MLRPVGILMINTCAIIYYLYAIWKLYKLPKEHTILNQLLHIPWYIFGIMANILAIFAFKSDHHRQDKWKDEKSTSTILWQSSFGMMFLQLHIGYALIVTANWIISLQNPKYFYIILLLLAVLPGILYSLHTFSGYFGPSSPVWTVRLIQIAVVITVGAHLYNSEVTDNFCGTVMAILMLFHLLFVSIPRDSSYVQEINLILPCFVSSLMLTALGSSIKRSAWILAESLR